MVEFFISSILILIYLIGLPCDVNGEFLLDGAVPPAWESFPNDDFSPFTSQAAFELADLLYRKDQMSAANINNLLQIWAATLPSDQDPPFINKDDLYSTIDAVQIGDAPWSTFSLSYNGNISEGDKTPWKGSAYEVWYRDPRTILHNQLKNRDFASEIDFAPKEVYDEKGIRLFTDFMSGNWAWRTAVNGFI